MKIESYKYPESSFLSIEKDTQTIVDKMLANERLKRLLYYNSMDALNRPNLTTEQTYNLLKPSQAADGSVIPALIRFVPKIYVDPVEVTYIVINFDNFYTSLTNPEFRDCTIQFNILCHFDLWNLDDMQLRPYKIAAEIDSMFNKARLSGIGTLQFAGANGIVINDTEFAGIKLMYQAVHGEDDREWNPKDTKPEVENDLELNIQQLLNALD